MTMKCNDIIHGFQINRVRQIEELKGTFYEMEHVKTGAQLAWLDNKEENKLFSITFNTTPSDSTGVFHILEHSVFCGSKRYPVKDPFIELLKGSLQTFLNAMTMPDKTSFPVSSRNEKDFFNLMRVYLDAVFQPAIYENPNIFYQEGWHYEMDSVEDVPRYNGVVYNEMKGAFTSVDQLLEKEFKINLYPDNCYGYESGGDPDIIPQLTYERFLETHKKYYHPSNARIYLDGSIDIDKTLDIIDREYLSEYDKNEFKPFVERQGIIPSFEKTIPCEAMDEWDCTQMIRGNLIGDWTERKKMLAVQILAEYLIGSNESPLKKAVLSSGLATDINMMVLEGLKQPSIYTRVWNLDYEKREELCHFIDETLREILKAGLNREEIEATINLYEFQMKDVAEPTGLGRCMNMLNSWCYDGDPLLYMTCEDQIAEIKEEIYTDYFEKVLEEVFLPEDGIVTIYAKPSLEYGDQKREQEYNMLSDLRDHWTEEEREHVIKCCEDLRIWQQTPETKEGIASIPTISLDELEKDAKEFETQEHWVDGVKVLFHPADTSDLLHMSLYFPLCDIQPEDLSKIGFIASLYSNLPTEHYSLEELQRVMKNEIGNLYFDIEVYSKEAELDTCKIYLTAHCSILKEKYEQAARIIQEILLRTKWDAIPMIHEFVQQCDDYFQENIMMDGHAYAIKKIFAHFSAEGAAKEIIEGHTCYEWMHHFLEHFEDEIDDYVELANQTVANTFTRNHMMVSFTAEKMPDQMACLFDGFPWKENRQIAKNEEMPEGNKEQIIGTKSLEEDCEDLKIRIDMKKLFPEKDSEITIPTDISYSAFGTNLYTLGVPFHGSLRVLAKILTLDYLWNEIRMQGGAYDTGCRVSFLGELSMYSYRDPDGDRSLAVYKKIADYIRSFCKSEESIEKYIISTIADMEPLLSAKDEGRAADIDYLRGVNYEILIRTRDEMLETTKEKLLEYCDVFEQVAQEGASCMVHMG